MKRFQTQGIVLRRVNYGEADRVITFLTPNFGKLGVMAKGVRKPKSKLAGGIELFSVSDITLLEGKGELNQLVGTRLETNFRGIVRDYDVVKVGYRALELVNNYAEGDESQVYFDLLKDTFGLLDSERNSHELVEAWFSMQLLKLRGNIPNLTHDSSGALLDESKKYTFDISEGSFQPASNGNFDANLIKAWRVLAVSQADKLSVVKGLEKASIDRLDILRQFVDYVQ